ncbi:MAG: hypothetical protein AB1Z29_13795, partial [Desulfobacterales bacterium]
MKLSANKILRVLLPIAVLLIPIKVPAHEQSQVDQISTAKPEAPAPALDLAEIIPLAATLSSRLAALEKTVT